MDFIIEKDKNRIRDIVFNLKNDLFSKNISEEKLMNIVDKFCNNAVFLVGIIGTEVVGYIAFYCNDYINNKAFISIIVIKSIYQNRGYGKLFIDEASRISYNSGMTTLNLQVNINNVNAIKFYQKRGFNICKKSNEMYTMELNINKYNNI